MTIEGRIMRDSQWTEQESRALSAAHGSLARGVHDSAPGTLFALAIAGGIEVRPDEGREITFGRNRPDVHVCVGEDDRRVSRRHGSFTYHNGQWWLRNEGRLPIRLPESRLLFDNEDPIPLGAGYTPMFLPGSTSRAHLLEVYVIGADGERPLPRHHDITQPPRTWVLQDAERLALVVLGQRYLLQDHRPQPLTWRQAADQLSELQPAAGWTAKRVEHLIVSVRTRLSKAGIAGLTREEVGEPVGNALNHNLITELLLSTTLVPPDLALLD